MKYFIAGILLGIIIAGIAYMFLHETAPEPCPGVGQVNLKKAAETIARYQHPSNSNKLLADTNNAILESWRIERCQMINAFHEFQNADAIQIYLGLDSLGSPTLVWVPSASIQGGGFVDLIDMSSPNILDMTQGCPHHCPENSELTSRVRQALIAMGTTPP